jgi:hypothetical protein
MTEKDYQRMLDEIEAECAEAIHRAQAERVAAREHVEFVWRRFNGGLFKPEKVSAVHADKSATNSGSGERGSLIVGIKTAVKSLDLFTRDDVVKYLNKHFPDLRAGEREGSITSNLSRLNSAGELETVTKATREQQQVYRKTAKFNMETGVSRAPRKTESKRKVAMAHTFSDRTN